MSREGVAQRVHAEACLLVDLPEKARYRFLYGADADAPARPREKDRHAIRGRADRPDQLVALRLVISERERRRVADGNDSLLAPLPAHLRLLRHKVEVTPTQPLELREPHAG
jgi:hypothetical protein